MTSRLILLCVSALLCQATVGRLSAQDRQDQLLHYSLLVDVDDEARVQFAAAEMELARGDLLTAASRWRALLDSGRPDALVPCRGVLQSAPTAVRTLLRTQPPAIRNEYRAITEPLAGRELAAALGRDETAALWAVVDRFPLTDAAQQACVHLAERCFDSAEFSDCVDAVDRWLLELDDLPARVAQQPRMIVWQTIALYTLGDRLSAERQWARFQPMVPPDLAALVHGLDATRLVPQASGANASAAPGSHLELADLLPATAPVWRHSLAERAPLNDWRMLCFDFEELAHPLLMLNRPRIDANGMIVSGLRREAIDRDGRVRWTPPDAGPAASQNRSGSLDSLRAALGESIAGRLVIVGGDVLTIEPRPAQGRPAPPYSTQLTARSLATGEHRWTIDEFPLPSGEAPGTILGLPAERRGQLVMAVQVGEELLLLSLDAATRSFRWQTRLGDAGLSLMTDSRRRWMPAIIDATGESIVCATGNGAVVSVDARNGRIQWIHRSDREDWRGAGPPPMSVPTSMPRFRMWTGWREPVLVRLGSQIFWAGPESNALIALDARTGEQRWSQPRGDSLAVVTAGAALLTISPDKARRIDPEDGRLVWSAPISPPAGTGFAAAGRYLLPLRSGGAVALDVETGSAIRSVAWNHEIEGRPLQGIEQFRTLTWTPEGIVVQSPAEISLHPTLAQSAARSPALSTQPQWLAAAGRLTEAEQAISATDAQAVRWKSRLMLVRQETVAEQCHLIDNPAAHVGAPVADEVLDYVAEFLLDRRPETAIALIERTPLPVLSGIWLETNRAPRVRLRADVLAAASIAQRTVDSPEPHSPVVSLSPALQNRLDRLVERLQSGRDSEVADLLELLTATDWGAERRLAFLDKPQRSHRPTHDFLRRRLAIMRLESLGGDVAPRARQLARSTTRNIAPPWPEAAPVPAAVRPWNSFINQWPMPVQPDPQADLAGLSVDFQLQGFDRRRQSMGVHFAGAGQGSPWSIDLPKSNRSLAQSADYRQAQTVGPLVLVQAGTGLFGIVPFDEAGERRATHIWDVPWIDQWGAVASQSVSFLPRLSDVAPGRHPLDLDDFGRPLTQTGPVTSARFYYREFDRLVACDTATGRRLWDRRPFPADALAAGDENHLLLVLPRQNRIVTLDPLDGRLLADRPFGESTGQWRGTIGATAVLRSRESPSPAAADSSGLAAFDLVSGQIRWRHAVEANAVEFLVGRRLVGTVEPTAIRLFDVASGKQQASLPLELSREVADVYAIDDPFALMICVFGPPAIEQLRPPLMLVGNRRRPYANGTVYGLDPATLKLKWTLNLDRSVFPLDQPTDIPLLVINDAVLFIDENGQELRNDRIRCFDKRTGRQVGDDLLGQYIGGYGFVIDRDQTAGWIQVRTSKGIFRYDFSAGPPP